MTGFRTISRGLGIAALALTVPCASTAQRSIALDSQAPGNPTLSMEADGSTGSFFYGGGAFFLLGGAALNLQSVPTGETFISVVGSAVLSNSGQSMRYWTDSNNNGPTGNHIWHQDSLDSGDRMMQLQHTHGGDLLIAGSLTQMQMFDLAESFWERQPVEPGQLVAVDPGRPDAVRPTRRAYEPGLVGVASARPGIVLGGSVFSPEMLRSVWGPARALRRYVAREAGTSGRKVVPGMYPPEAGERKRHR